MKQRGNNTAYIGETKKRSLLKSFVWRVLGFFVLGTISWIVTHNWGTTSLITITYQMIQIVLYYFHERYWGKVEWGRIKLAEFERGNGEGI